MIGLIGEKLSLLLLCFSTENGRRVQEGPGALFLLRKDSSLAGVSNTSTGAMYMP